VAFDDLPAKLRREINDISALRLFQNELAAFLKINGLPGIDTNRSDGWTHFAHLYAMVVEDCPLAIRPTNTNSTIENVTIHLELANKPIETHMLYKITWTISDKNGLSGDFFVMNS